MAETAETVQSIAHRKTIGPDDFPAALVKLVLDNNDTVLKLFP